MSEEEEHVEPPEGWAAFFGEHGPALMRAAAAVLGRHVRAGLDAEGVVSEVTAKLIARRIPKGWNPKAYALRSVRNAALDAVKTINRFTDEDLEFEKLIGAEDIEEDVDDALLVESVIEALDELPEREAHAIREKVMKNRHWSEVAPELGVTTSQGLGKIVAAALAKIRATPRFAELLPDVSTSQPPSTATGTTGTST